jgi:serine/threonine-protein kinase RsbW
MDKGSADKFLQIDNQISELTRLAVFIEELGEEWGLQATLVISLNLVLEEALTNIILYGFDDGGSHNIALDFKKAGDELIITIIDDGKEFDPTLRAEPDITLSVEDRPVGGLGIHLIKKIMNKVEYKRVENRNYLLLKKNIKS